ncbi:DNA oxidative demethylase [Heracleum sosnowskyi]|uniref:DNA N(6)-methyladenine demethylase n=1 Tax=Heracleum sosnowskyi TaxID=360622 RepID=A0AAD8H7N4_9APIA|nr:DNA oxidative demethylase [Heracleum sosnowskyi]
MMNHSRGRRENMMTRGRGRSSPSTHTNSHAGEKAWRVSQPSSPSTLTSANTNPPVTMVGVGVSSDDGHLDGKGNMSCIHEHAEGGSSANGLSRQFNKSVSVGSSSVDFGKPKPVPVEGLNTSKHLVGEPTCKFTNDRQLPTQSNDHTENNVNLQEPELSQPSKVLIEATSHERGTNCSSEEPFEICLKKSGTPKLKASLLVLNREKRNENKLSMGGLATKILRPGMVLLKNFISLKDQVEIVQTCQKLGKGNGGFYQPGYGDGAKMLLKMMCLGKNWDPKTGSYGERRPVDGAEPPPIPGEFHMLVQKAIQDTHAYLLEEVGQKNVESVLPSMTPDICIVNFYTSTGRLGLHKDKDESQHSLNRGLPVVSISIGDSAEFLYGDQMDKNKAEKVELRSGDVLIFGGKSRHVYHGVNSIRTKSAPHELLQETGLRPGRLNLTFRKY